MENNQIIIKDFHPTVKDFLAMPNGVLKNIAYKKRDAIVPLRVDYTYKDGCYYFASTIYNIKKSNSSYFLKVAKRQGFTLNEKGKLSIWYGESPTKFTYIDMLFSNVFQYTWLTSSFQAYLTKGLLEKILTKKVTNPVDFFNAWCKTMRIKASGKLVFKLHDRGYGSTGTRRYLLRAAKVMTNMDVFLQKWIDDDHYIHQNDLEDMIDQALTLECKIDPKWSAARMKEEHTRMTKILMDYEIDSVEDYTINYKETARVIMGNYPGITLLDTTKKIYAEARVMSHCLYTNYHDRIKNGLFLAFNVTHEGESGTLTLSSMVNGHCFLVIYQFLGKRNCTMGEKITRYAEEFVSYLNENIVMTPTLNIDSLIESYADEPSPRLLTYVEQEDILPF